MKAIKSRKRSISSFNYLKVISIGNLACTEGRTFEQIRYLLWRGAFIMGENTVKY